MNILKKKRRQNDGRSHLHLLDERKASKNKGGVDCAGKDLTHSFCKNQEIDLVIENSKSEDYINLLH